MYFDRVLGARKRAELFIAQLRPAADGVLVGVLLAKIPGHLNAIERILVQKRLRRLTRIVWCIERYIHEKRIAALFGLSQIVDRIVGPDFAPMLSALPEAAKRRIGWRPRVGLAR